MIDIAVLDPTWWTPGKVEALAASISALVAVIGIPFVAWQVRNAARDSRARSRPTVTATLVKTPYTKSFALQVANSGQSSARQLTVTFDPELPSATKSPDGQPSIVPFMIARYATPIAVFPPGATLSNTYYVGTAGPGGRIINAETTSDQVTVTLRYRDDDGRKYHDVFPLDVTVLQKETESIGSKSPQRQREQALKNLDDLAGWAKTAAQSIDELSSLGVRRRTKRADRRRDKHRQAEAEQHEKLVRQLSGDTPTETRSGRLRRIIAAALRSLATKINP